MHFIALSAPSLASRGSTVLLLRLPLAFERCSALVHSYFHCRMYAADPIGRKQLASGPCFVLQILLTVKPLQIFQEEQIISAWHSAEPHIMHNQACESVQGLGGKARHARQPAAGPGQRAAPGVAPE
jgi:hypothetical protein